MIVLQIFVLTVGIFNPMVAASADVVANNIGVVAKRENLDRDKTGTTGCPTNEDASQTLSIKAFARRFSLDAERGGFEPPVAVTPRRFSRPVHSATLPPLRGLKT